MTGPLEEKKAKNYALRIKTLVMKRRWWGLSMRRKNNYDKAQHIEVPLSFISLDDGEVVQTCLPPAHKDNGTISPNDKNDLVQNLSDTIDLHIDDFIQVEICRWDVSCFSIDSEPIYDIECGSQAEGVDFLSSEEWSSYIYDSDAW
jgi:hypothetical protein